MNMKDDGTFRHSERCISGTYLKGVRLSTRLIRIANDVYRGYAWDHSLYHLLLRGKRIVVPFGGLFECEKVMETRREG